MRERIEHDSMGEICVPAERYWGAQTQRSLENFPIGRNRENMPEEIIRAFAALKIASAEANHRLCPDRMTEEKLRFIRKSGEEILEGKRKDEFPLVVWQTGSGTQSNMNVNEVIANRGNELAGKRLLHPNDDVNMSQSSNDTFPTALHVAAAMILEEQVLPALRELADTMRRLEQPSNALFSILISPLGIDTLSRAVQPENAKAPMDVTPLLMITCLTEATRDAQGTTDGPV